MCSMHKIDKKSCWSQWKPPTPFKMECGKWSVNYSAVNEQFSSTISRCNTCFRASVVRWTWNGHNSETPNGFRIYLRSIMAKALNWSAHSFQHEHMSSIACHIQVARRRVDVTRGSEQQGFHLWYEQVCIAASGIAFTTISSAPFFIIVLSLIDIILVCLTVTSAYAAPTRAGLLKVNRRTLPFTPLCCHWLHLASNATTAWNTHSHLTHAFWNTQSCWCRQQCAPLFRHVYLQCLPLWGW